MKRGVSFFLALILLCSLFSCDRSKAPGEGEILLEFLDVGHADCALVRTRDTTVLIDAGGPESADRVMRHLRRAGITEIDCLVLTHAHSDHIGGAAAVLSGTSVRTCLMPNDAPDTDVFRGLLSALKSEDCAVQEAYRGITLTSGELVLSVLAPDMYAMAGEDEKSIALRLTYRDNSFLFMGDCTFSEEELILSHYGGADLSSQVLKVGHHGSRYATGEALLSAVRPEIAVISCGAGNFYGFPHAETIARLSAALCRTLRTDIGGTVTLVGDGREVKIIK